MERSVTTLKTSKRLKAAGFDIDEAAFTWAYFDDGPRDADGAPYGETWNLVLTEWTVGNDAYTEVEPTFAAPTATEIYLASGKDSHCNFAMPEDAAHAWLALNEGRIATKAELETASERLEKHIEDNIDVFKRLADK